MDAMMDMERARGRRGFTAREIAAEAKISEWRVRDEIRTLQAQGLVESVGFKIGKTNPPRTYAMTRTKPAMAEAAERQKLLRM